MRGRVIIFRKPLLKKSGFSPWVLFCPRNISLLLADDVNITETIRLPKAWGADRR